MIDKPRLGFFKALLAHQKLHRYNLGLAWLGPLALLWQIYSPGLFTDPSSAVWASQRWRPKNEIDDGLAYRRQARLRWRSVDSFFPPRLCEATMLQEGVSDHGHERVTMQTLPGSPLEVIKPDFFFQLLMPVRKSIVP